LVYNSIYDSTEEAIRKMIEASQRMIGQRNSSAVNNHFKLQIKTLLQNTPRDADRLEALLREKEREKQQATHIEDTQRWLQTWA
jgi:hypothetical protein